MAEDSHWEHFLDRNSYGRRILSVERASQLAASGEISGWYVAPHAMKWTVGRQAGTERYHVVDSNGEPLVFDSTLAAQEFLFRLKRLSHPRR
jgi:hypothetical protein